jgi:hypothetical protein
MAAKKPWYVGSKIALIVLAALSAAFAAAAEEITRRCFCKNGNGNVKPEGDKPTENAS